MTGPRQPVRGRVGRGLSLLHRCGWTRGRSRRLTELTIESQVQFQHVDRGFAQKSEVAARDGFIERSRDTSDAHGSCVRHARDLPTSRDGTDVRIESAA